MTEADISEAGRWRDTIRRAFDTQRAVAISDGIDHAIEGGAGNTVADGMAALAMSAAELIVHALPPDQRQVAIIGIGLMILDCLHGREIAVGGSPYRRLTGTRLQSAVP